MAPSNWRGREQQLVFMRSAEHTHNVSYPPLQQDAQMRGARAALAAKRPSAGLSARNRSLKRNQEKKLPDGRGRWTKFKEDYPLLRAMRTGRQDSAAPPHEATHS